MALHLSHALSTVVVHPLAGEGGGALRIVVRDTFTLLGRLEARGKVAAPDVPSTATDFPGECRNAGAFITGMIAVCADAVRVCVLLMAACRRRRCWWQHLDHCWHRQRLFEWQHRRGRRQRIYLQQRRHARRPATPVVPRGWRPHRRVLQPAHVREWYGCGAE